MTSHSRRNPVGSGTGNAFDILRTICANNAGLLMLFGILGPAVSLVTYVLIQVHDDHLPVEIPTYTPLLWLLGGMACCIGATLTRPGERWTTERVGSCFALMTWSMLLAMPIAAVVLFVIGLFDPAIGTSYLLNTHR